MKRDESIDVSNSMILVQLNIVIKRDRNYIGFFYPYIYTWTRRSVIALFRNIFIQNCHDKNKVLFIIDGAPTTNDTWTIAVGLLYIQQDIF